MSIFVRFIDACDNKLVGRFLGIVKLTTSKKAVDLHEIMIKHPESKNLDSLCIRFSGLDVTNAMSGEQKGLQRLIRHTAPHSQYLNCRNHRLSTVPSTLNSALPKTTRSRWSSAFAAENVQI